jgi:hypothetical protein
MLMRLLMVSLACAGFIWPEAAQLLGGLVLFFLIFGKPRNDTDHRESRRA